MALGARLKSGMVMENTFCWLFVSAFHPEDGDVIFLLDGFDIYQYETGSKVWQFPPFADIKSRYTMTMKRVLHQYLHVHPLVCHSLGPTRIPDHRSTSSWADAMIRCYLFSLLWYSECISKVCYFCVYIWFAPFIKTTLSKFMSLIYVEDGNTSPFNIWFFWVQSLKVMVIICMICISHLSFNFVFSSYICFLSAIIFSVNFMKSARTFSPTIENFRRNIFSGNKLMFLLKRNADIKPLLEVHNSTAEDEQ